MYRKFGGAFGRFATLAFMGLACARASDAPLPESASACFSDRFHARIQTGLDGYADINDIPGVSLAVVVRDSLVHASATGFANRTERRAATPDTPYYIASVTKAFTATLAILLAGDGLVDLDAPIARYLPDSVSAPHDAAGKSLTVRQLLTHTAGLSRSPPNRKNQKIDDPLDPGVWEAYNTADLYSALRTTTVTSVAGKQLAYSNYGYAILGHLLERAADKPFEQLLRERIIVPLGMTSTSITLSPQQSAQLAAFYWGEDPNRIERPERAHFGEVAAFIGLTSTARDVASFLSAQLGMRPRVISSAAISMMQEVFLDADKEPAWRFARTLGWFRRTRADGSDAVFYHTGDVDGHSSAVAFSPSQGVGAVVLQNLGGSVAEQGAMDLTLWSMRVAAAEMSATPACVIR